MRRILAHLRDGANEERPLPAACTLGSEDYADRRRAWKELADHALVEQRETARGMQLSYSPEPGVEDKLRELASLEQDCCEFAIWQVESRNGGLILDVTAPGESVEALRSMFS